MNQTITLLNQIENLEKTLETFQEKQSEGMEPKKETINSILNYSKSLEVQKLERIGTVLTNLN